MSDVAPHAGARIETFADRTGDMPMYVAPHAGARIETRHGIAMPERLWSPLTRGRGLKQDRRQTMEDPSRRPSRGGAD